MLRITYDGIYKGVGSLQISMPKEGDVFILFSKGNSSNLLSIDNVELEFLFTIIHITNYINGQRVPMLSLPCFLRESNYIQLINSFHKQMSL